jgi:glycyl-tRNA synthetase
MVISIADITSYCKRRGIVYPNSEIYGGLAGFYDYGPVGVEIANNLKSEWWNAVVHRNANIVGMNGAIITNSKVWEASGHVKNFVDLLVKCKKCKHSFRADHLVEDALRIPTDGLSAEKLNEIIKKNKLVCPDCKGSLEDVTKFSPMFMTSIGPSGEECAYLRPETAQVIFTQFKNILETSRQKLPFGIAQIGKAFRNEISPRNFLFRLREFEQMELEFFTHPKQKDDCPHFSSVEHVGVKLLTAKAQESKEQKEMDITIGDLYNKKIVKTKWHAYWIGFHYKWLTGLGLHPENLRLREHRADELSHYSSATVDIEYNYEFGWKELMGIADRGDFDLKQHSEHSKTDMTYFDEATKEKVLPHVAAEPSIGVDRAFLTFIIDAYHEEEVKGEKRIVLKLHPKLAAFKAAVFPLVNKEGMDKKAKEIYEMLNPHFTTFYDDSGSIGRRYRRQDEIGTPFCITVDGQTMKDNTVTIRDRDSLKQERVAINDLITKLNKQIGF